MVDLYSLKKNCLALCKNVKSQQQIYADDSATTITPDCDKVIKLNFHIPDHLPFYTHIRPALTCVW